MGTTMVEPSVARPLPALKREIQLNTLHGLLGNAGVLPLVFTKSEEWAEIIQEEVAGVSFPAGRDQRHNSWSVTTANFQSKFELERKKGAGSGLPVYRDVMRELERAAIAAGAPYFGYTNGDILFGRDLEMTLRMIQEAVEDGFIAQHRQFSQGNPRTNTDGRPEGLPQGLLIIGRRCAVVKRPSTLCALHVHHTQTTSTLMHVRTRGTCP
jgi:hypothetical protein